MSTRISATTTAKEISLPPDLKQAPTPAKNLKVAMAPKALQNVRGTIRRKHAQSSHARLCG